MDLTSAPSMAEPLIFRENGCDCARSRRDKIARMRSARARPGYSRARSIPVRTAGTMTSCGAGAMKASACRRVLSSPGSGNWASATGARGASDADCAAAATCKLATCDARASAGAICAAHPKEKEPVNSASKVKNRRFAMEHQIRLAAPIVHRQARFIEIHEQKQGCAMQTRRLFFAGAAQGMVFA